MKKVVSLVLSLVLLLGCMAPAFAAETAVVVANPTSIKAGEEVSIVVTMPSGIPALTALAAEVVYDVNSFDVKSAPTGWLFEEGSASAKGNWMATDVINGDNLAGTTLTFTFVSTANADAGDYTFDFSFDSDNTFDAYYETVEINGGVVTVTIAGAAHEHTWSTNWTYDETGHWKTCGGCDEKNEYAVHSWGEGTVTTEPTESTKGVRTYTCECGATKTEEIDVLPHTHTPSSEWTYDETGHWKTCGGCSEKLQYAVHSWGEGTVTTEPTESTKGVRTYTCECGATKTEEIDVLPHTHTPSSEWTYDETGHWKTCGGCDEKLNQADHTYGDWIVTTPATATEDGVETRTCSVCGATETRAIESTGGSTTGGSTTGGSTTGGSTTGGSTTGGSTTGGSTTGGSTTGGSTTGGSTTGGSTTGGSTTGGSTTGGSTTGGSTTGGSTTGGSTTGGSTTGGSTTGGSTTGGSTTGGSTTGGSTTGGSTTGGSTTPVTPIVPVVPTYPVLPGDVVYDYYDDIAGHWCEDLINKWTALGVFNGVADRTFDPDGKLTRAQAVTIFSRWLKLEKTADIRHFADVPADAWYTEYVAKCYAAGIVNGKSATEFDPNAYITRAEMFTMLCRALGIEGQSELKRDFTDTKEIPEWAREYTYALINLGYVNGMTETTLEPQGNLTRAQMVKLIDNVSVLA